MGKWFLSGGGDAHQTERLDRHFAGSLCPHKPLLYIRLPWTPTGMMTASIGSAGSFTRSALKTS
ncbi:hypothetical protein [Bacillus paralicheniformis]|uniref:hypothetical protein n=1 Tax=Bacillus paralicheniformis TaxID=1648923 RepID=UPI001D0478E9|nr:hypothetical protein [Bacillus paralicheniformis]